jgi:hypothetical protein
MMASSVAKPNIFRRVLTRFTDYCKLVGGDYKNAIKDAYTDSRARPIKASIIGMITESSFVGHTLFVKMI